jgi:hypothetical protein
VARASEEIRILLTTEDTIEKGGAFEMEQPKTTPIPKKGLCFQASKKYKK